MKVIDWGLIDYTEALKKQETLLEEIHLQKSLGALIFCSHPAVVTLGRKTQKEDVFAWKGPVIEISRGGRATYHGPSQLVIYPIINLDSAVGFPRKDIGWYLRTLEKSIVLTLKNFGIEAIGKSLQKKSPEEIPMEETGVWVGAHKIASLGIGVRKWITFHGAAINLDADPTAFVGMNPCGFKSEVMTNAEQVLGKKIDRDLFKKQFSIHFENLFSPSPDQPQEKL
jgi:lipoyl(octanoyl) transferase